MCALLRRYGVLHIPVLHKCIIALDFNACDGSKPVKVALHLGLAHSTNIKIDNKECIGRLLIFTAQLHFLGILHTKWPALVPKLHAVQRADGILCIAVVLHVDKRKALTAARSGAGVVQRDVWLRRMPSSSKGRGRTGWVRVMRDAASVR